MDPTINLKNAIRDGKITQEDFDTKFIMFSPTEESAIIWATFPGTEDGFVLLLAERERMPNVHHSFTVPSTMLL